eukprot:2128076-Amphidinium_carterae.1
MPKKDFKAEGKKMLGLSEGKNHVVDPREVLNSTGDTWEKWKQSILKELESLKGLKLWEISSTEAMEMKKRARSAGRAVQDIPAMIVFTMKKDGAHKTRI